MEIDKCKLCDIAYRRTNIVKGDGNIKGDIIIIGEAPGYYEDKKGRPFVGQSGVYLRQVLSDTGFSTINTYITNIIKCRPPSNRKPTKVEIKNCSVHLDNELAENKHNVIILLGRTAHETMFGKSDKALSVLCKNAFITKNGNIIFTMYHPSYVVRNIELLDSYYRKLFNKIYNYYVKTYNNNYEHQKILANGET